MAAQLLTCTANPHEPVWLCSCTGLLHIGSSHILSSNVRAICFPSGVWSCFGTYISQYPVVCGNAVLLEAFFAAMKDSENSNRMATQLEQQSKHAAALDPQLATLANFSSPQHLLSQFDIVFEIFDVDDNGCVDYTEMSASKYRRISIASCAFQGCRTDCVAETFEHC